MNPLPDQEAPTQLVSEDLPMSEGFPWQSQLDSTCSAPPPHCPLPAPPKDSAGNDAVIDTPSHSRPREPSEQPSAAVEDCSSFPTAAAAAAASVEVEPNLEEDENGHLGSSNTGKKRRHKRVMESHSVCF